MGFRKVAYLAPCLFALFGLRCATTEFDASIVDVQPLSNSTASPESHTHSDVSEPDGSSIADLVKITVRNDMQYSSHEIRLQQYRVSYQRFDAESVEGITIPNNISTTPILGVIKPGGTGEVEIEIVKDVAKQRPPLAALRAGVDQIDVFAEISLFGRVLGTNQAVTLTVTHQITFADFPD